LKCISDKSASIVVIAHAAIKILKKQGISCKNCIVIPHGCPKIDLVDNEPIKASLGLKNRLVASTFGLISGGKGIEYTIRALPYVVEKGPRIVYLIIGQTHPEVRKNEGEKYRNELMKLVSELRLEDNVRFDNGFLSKGELIRYLQATDIYLTPYISPNQISSGALTYALDAGKPAGSTPYFHAQELLAKDRGILCKFNDPASLSDGITNLLDESLRKTIQRRVYRYSRRFLWSNVARTYGNLFNALIENYGWIQTGLPADMT
jgi:glycosyltransferase involved in cell wall biosynthesis